MALPQDLVLLLDLARAEAKRAAHGSVGLIHIAAAQLRRDREKFSATYGTDAAAQVEAALAKIPPAPGSPRDSEELVQLLATMEGGAEPASALAAAIRGIIQGGPAVAMAGAAPPGAAAAGAPAAAPPRVKKRLDKGAVLEALRTRVVGQDAALQTVVSRLALTRADFDLAPHRPDGIFLFAGPTGVGKTAMATAMAECVFGSADNLIRLDMSEYSHDWAVSRLIGPQPGYVGSDKPEGWLTTRVKKRPESLILLDEIEKSHPTVWNTFLQIFDAGRLTDGQGVVADFSSAIIVMTSNLGSESFRRKSPIGFRTAGEAASGPASHALDAVKEAMPPELVNRLDAIVVFDALSPEAIRRIAAREVEGAVGRLREKGYELDIPAEVVNVLAEAGYDPAYGARHLHRNIEKHLLQTLIDHPPSRLRATVQAGNVVWQPET